MHYFLLDFYIYYLLQTYIDENGCKITEKTYFISTTPSLQRSKTGSGWYKNEKEYTWTSGTKMTYYAEGYFSWGNGEVSVTNASGSRNNVPSNIRISGISTKYGTGNYAGVFNKYAYVTYSFTSTNELGTSNDFSTTIRVSESGNTI